MSPSLDHVEHWVFDMDDTLYPPECGLMGRVQDRINAFFVRTVGMEADEARLLQRQYLRDHGTSLSGLMLNHDVDPHAFLDEVHRVDLDCLTPDPVLREGLSRLPGRRLVFTNGAAAHAERVLAALQIADLFDDVFHIEASDLIPKPDPRAFARMIERHGVDPRRAAFFEDTEKNLKPAADMGMATVLVGAHAPASTAAFVDHRAESLPPFLNRLALRDAA
ncbi:MAG: putative hydrolase of the HAD superfamily [Brevundimonas sp.]|uniref:pyrimidine 5'-nucleotidase n=1 Tax=Brevundimonas sp. TaxID=1871086 RepID=UPI0039E4C897